MALLTTATATNRIIDQSLSVTYSKVRVTGSWSYTSGTSVITVNSAWEYTRRATMSLHYVGMTKAAADLAAAQFRENYERTIYSSYWKASAASLEHFDDESAGKLLMTDIAVVHDEGEAYSVVIQVSETDSRIRQGNHTASTLFGAENNRDYVFDYPAEEEEEQ